MWMLCLYIVCKSRLVANLTVRMHRNGSDMVVTFFMGVFVVMMMVTLTLSMVVMMVMLLLVMIVGGMRASSMSVTGAVMPTVRLVNTSN